MQKEALAILKKYKIPITEQRLSVLLIFLNSTESINHNMLEKRTADVASRYSIYRSLKLFLKNGIIHSLPSEDGIIWYTLQKGIDKKQAAQHVHFLCRICGKIYCLPEVRMPSIKLSSAFVAETTDVIVKGRCQTCS